MMLDHFGEERGAVVLVVNCCLNHLVASGRAQALQGFCTHGCGACQLLKLLQGAREGGTREVKRDLPNRT